MESSGSAKAASLGTSSRAATTASEASYHSAIDSGLVRILASGSEHRLDSSKYQSSLGALAHHCRTDFACADSSEAQWFGEIPYLVLV